MLMTAACAPAETGNKTEPESPAKKTEFVKGADISWVTEMERDGVTFYNTDGRETECTALMKEIGFDAVRLRVWTDPEGCCGMEDVLVKAKRAHALGMKIMIDFHYSDFFADPGRQTIPAAWEGFNMTELSKAVADHTKETLKLLKDNSINVDWVQIGNEVNSGMLWPSGKVSGNSAGNFIQLLNAGHDAAKSVYPDTEIILHVSNGHDSGLFEWFFGLMASGGAKYDIIGMSLYPTWWENGGWTAWKPNVDKCLANIRSMNTKFGKPVMLCEIGMPVGDPQRAKDAITYFISESSKIEAFLGVFYWEPQTDGAWKPETYDGLGWGPYTMGAFKDGRPTAALDGFKD